MHQDGISVVLPVYNEFEAIAQNALPLYDSLVSLAPDISFEILLVDNASTDGTPEQVSALLQGQPHIRYLRTETKGRGAAMRLGFAEAKGAYIAVLSIDRAWGEDFIPRAKGFLDLGQDVVFGPKSHPLSQLQRPLARTLGSQIIRAILAVLFQMRPIDTQCIKMFRRDRVPFLSDLGDYNYFAETEFYLRTRSLQLRHLAIPVTVSDFRRDSKVRLRSFLEFLGEAMHFWRKIKFDCPHRPAMQTLES